MKNTGPIVALALLVAACSTQGETHDSHETHDPKGHAAEVPSSTQALGNASGGPHDAMNMISADDADNDFLRAMIPHHQGAVDMARAELKHGRDPQVRALAERVIAAQEAEMVQMRAWLAARGASMDKPAKADAK